MPNVVAVLQTLSKTFDALGISYMVGGSVASSALGEYRSTNDVDFVADIREEHVDALVSALESEFYIDADMIRDAMQERASFNVIYLPTMIKADVFLKQNSAWVESEWARRQLVEVGIEETVSVYLPSAEDMILQKLVWFRLGGGVSDRQWRDITGMLKVKAPSLDYAYLQKWAANLKLTELLEQAYDDSGIAP